MCQHARVQRGPNSPAKYEENLDTDLHPLVPNLNFDPDQGSKFLNGHEQIQALRLVELVSLFRFQIHAILDLFEFRIQTKTILHGDSPLS